MPMTLRQIHRKLHRNHQEWQNHNMNKNMNNYWVFPVLYYQIVSRASVRCGLGETQMVTGTLFAASFAWALRSAARWFCWLFTLAALRKKSSSGHPQLYQTCLWVWAVASSCFHLVLMAAQCQAILCRIQVQRFLKHMLEKGQLEVGTITVWSAAIVQSLL